MGRPNRDTFLQKHYDKLIVAGVFAFLAYSVTAYVSGKAALKSGDRRFDAELSSLKPAHPDVAKASDAMYVAALDAIKNPAESSEKKSFLVAPERVFCVNCKAPIPLKFDTCPYCEAAQPSETVTEDWDTDGDGLPDAWEKEHGLNPLEAGDALADADNDGFTNIEEYKAGTDIRDPKSHPPRADFLRVAKIDADTFPYVLRGKSLLPGGNYKFQFNTLAAGGQTLYLKKGDPVGKTGFVFDSYEARREIIKRPGMPDKEGDVYYVKLVKGADGIELCENGKPVSSTFVATFVCTKDREVVEYTAGRGESFTFDGEKFTLKDIDRRAGSAVLTRASGAELKVPAK